MPDTTDCYQEGASLASDLLADKGLMQNLSKYNPVVVAIAMTILSSSLISTMDIDDATKGRAINELKKIMNRAVDQDHTK